MGKTKAASPKAISRTEVKAPGHLRLGELCPHYGGVFAGLVRGQDKKPDYYLFVPPDHTAQASLLWGGYEHDEPGAKDSHDGLANTRTQRRQERNDRRRKNAPKRPPLPRTSRRWLIQTPGATRQGGRRKGPVGGLADWALATLVFSWAVCGLVLLGNLIVSMLDLKSTTAVVAAVVIAIVVAALVRVLSRA